MTMRIPSYIRYFLLCCLLCLGMHLFAQTGPGGVGNTAGTSSLRLWVRADAGVTLASGKVQQWNDQSGYGNHLTMTTTANQPDFATNVFNGYPAVRYTASLSTFFNSGSSGPGSNSLTIVLFAKGSSYQSLIRYQNNSGTFLVYPWEFGGGRTFITSSDGGTSTNINTGLVTGQKNIGVGRYRRNLAATGFQTFLNGSIVTQSAAANSPLPSQPFFSGRYNPGSSEYPTADVPEMIIYYDALNEAQRIIVENYLAAKYDTLLSANDLYTMDNAANGNYDHDVAGIGQASDGSNHTTSRGTGIVQVSGATALGNNDFFFWGKNNIAPGFTTTTNMPSTGPQNIAVRWAAEWRVRETAEVGNINISFDLTGMGPVNTSHLRLLIDTDNDGLFSDEVNGTGVISGATSLGGNVYQFSGVDIDNAERFTLGSTNVNTTPLPVGLIHFTADAGENNVEIAWATAAEKDNERFELYRSADAEEWQLTATVKGRGTSNTRHDYAFTDEDPLDGISYYRLTDVDFEGNETTSRIIQVEMSAPQNEVSIFPNPSTGGLQLHSREPVRSFDIRLFDLLGNEVSVNWNYHDQNTLLLSKDLLPGVYFIRYRINRNEPDFKKIQVIK